MAEEPKNASIQTFSAVEFFEEAALHKEVTVVPMWRGSTFLAKRIRAYCDSPTCGGERTFSFEEYCELHSKDGYYFVFRFLCQNCVVNEKSFTVFRRVGQDAWFCKKVYENPPAGEPIPRRLYDMMGEENRELLQKARRSRTTGLGVGAYAYYRRIVEKSKNDLVESILAASRRLDSPPSVIDSLECASKETQFSKAISIVKDEASFPTSLLIRGHNPLTLLHDILSVGIHELSDEDCLARAADAETILFQLADRMNTALTESASVDVALKNTFSRYAKKSTSLSDPVE